MEREILVKMKAELASLSENCDKLEAFLLDDEKTAQLDSDYVYLMDRQLDAMMLYKHFLEERIEYMEESLEPEDEETEDEDDEDELPFMKRYTKINHTGSGLFGDFGYIVCELEL